MIGVAERAVTAKVVLAMVESELTAKLFVLSSMLNGRRLILRWGENHPTEFVLHPGMMEVGAQWPFLPRSAVLPKAVASESWAGLRDGEVFQQVCPPVLSQESFHRGLGNPGATGAGDERG